LWYSNISHGFHNFFLAEKNTGLRSAQLTSSKPSFFVKKRHFSSFISKRALEFVFITKANTLMKKGFLAILLQERG
jgi:hypothetical protein